MREYLLLALPSFRGNYAVIQLLLAGRFEIIFYKLYKSHHKNKWRQESGLKITEVKKRGSGLWNTWRNTVSAGYNWASLMVAK